jgi:hypothetical protein
MGAILQNLEELQTLQFKLNLRLMALADQIPEAFMRRIDDKFTVDGMLVAIGRAHDAKEKMLLALCVLRCRGIRTVNADQLFDFMLSIGEDFRNASMENLLAFYLSNKFVRIDAGLAAITETGFESAKQIVYKLNYTTY